jgi:dTDP-4-dehydrorhamnose reductase
MRDKPRIAILGANGQVGSELAMLMHLSEDVHPVAVARSAYSLAPLHMLGIECHVANNDTLLAEVLHNCGAAVELVHPWMPNIGAMRRAISDRLRLIDGALPAGAPMIYCSTQSVYRLDPSQPRFTLYGSTKRHAERETQRICQRSGRPWCILRLGQVNGAMQGATLSVISLLRRYDRVRVPDIPSFTVFVTSIEETVRRFVAGEVPQDTYTMVSDPAWSYAELVEWMATEANNQVEIQTVLATTAPRTSVKGLVRNAVWMVLNRHRDKLTALATAWMPDRYEAYRQVHYRGLAASQLAEHDAATEAPMLFMQYIELPGRRVPGMSDSRVTMPPQHAQLKKLLTRLTARC